MNEWRSTTSRIAVGAVSEEYILATAHSFTSQIMEVWEPFTNADTSLDESGLREIAYKAFDLAKKMGMQRAIFGFEPMGNLRLEEDGPLVPFESTTMDTSYSLETLHANEFDAVLFGLAPGLRKWGNSDGKELTNPSLIVKTDVLVIRIPYDTQS